MSNYNVESQHKKGKFHAIERIEKILDLDSFYEIGSQVRHHCDLFGMSDKDLPYDGVITGFGLVNGKSVAIYSQDFTIMGGTLGEMHGKKISRIINLAIESKCPLIGINDSGGARIQEGINSLGGYGDIFKLNTMASGYIPQISIIVGPCAGGAVYSPGITDFIFMVDSISHMFVTGPQVIKKVLFQQVDSASLGGSLLHSTISGVAHVRTSTENECFEKVRNLLSYLPQYWNDTERVLLKNNRKTRSKKQLSMPLVPDNPKLTYDIRSIINPIIDEESFFEISQEFAKNIVVGFGKIENQVVGIIANQSKVLSGVLDCDASDKASRFIRFCDAFNIPLITFVDVPGFLPGLDQEKKGIIRHGAKLLYTYSESTVPKITIVVRKAYGGAYIAMSSKHLGADFVYSWPTGEIAVMGAEGAVEILYKHEISKSDDPTVLRNAKEKEYTETFINPFIAAKNGIIDEVIQPEETRSVLIASLLQLKNKSTNVLVKKHGNIPL